MPISGGQQTSWVAAKTTAPAIITNGLQLFQADGDLNIHTFIGEITTSFDAAATTVQFQLTANGVTTTLSAATTTLASKPAGTTIAMQMGALANAPAISANAAGANVTPWGAIFIPNGGIISIAVVAPQTTGRMSFYPLFTSIETQRVAKLVPLV